MRIVSRHLLTAVSLCLAICAMPMGMAAGKNGEKPLQLVFYTPIAIEGNATTATTTLRLNNPNAAAAHYILTVQNAKASNTGQPAALVPAFYGDDNKPTGPVLEGNIAAGKSSSVRLDFSQIVEAGVTTAELANNGTKFAELKLEKNQGLPFRISLDGNPAEKPQIDFVGGENRDLFLRNEDSVHYPITWELFLKGKSVMGSTMVGPNGSTKITIVPDDNWFSLYQSFFKSEVADGSLILRYNPHGGDAGYPSKTIPIQGHLSSWSSTARGIVSTIVILFFLALGGGASVYINVQVVNRIKAISIKRRLDQLARVIGEIGPQLSSELRVSLWLERGRLAATLPKGILFTPETTATLTQADTDVSTLKGRVDLAEKISDAIRRQIHVNVPNIAPTLMDRIKKDLSDAQDLLKKSVLSDGELQKIQLLLGDATNLLDDIGNPNEDLEKKIAERVEILKARFTAKLLKDPICEAIKKQIPLPFGLLQSDTSKIDPQSDRDAYTRKLMVIADLIQMQVHNAEILECLQRRDLVSLPVAELLLTQLKEKVSLNHLCVELRHDPPKASIQIDRDTVRVSTPIMMRVVFDNWRLNQAAAKQQIECTWDFGHDGLTEKGWEVYHYFPNAATYHVEVTFKDIDKNEIKEDPIVCSVRVVGMRQEGRAYIALEVQRWALGFFVAIIGLFAGAKDKILSLDTAGAILAIFLLGFSIDTVKNLLVSK